ncbi:hypothetical protein PS15p_202060 [Mucor circinelloides]
MTIEADANQHSSKINRTFHDPVLIKYLLPTDTQEFNRLVKQHKAITTTLNGLFSAPISEQLQDGITVLDAGCGPGCWSIDMAALYKNSQFHGVDILDSQFPKESNEPANTQFVVGDLVDNIPYPDNTFDFIYQRLLSLAFTKEQWRRNLKELQRVLKPGGYVELIEYDHRKMLEYGPLFKKEQEAIEKYQVSRGMYPYVAENLCDILEDAGFTEIKKSVKQQAFCSSDSADKGMELTGDAILCAFESLGSRLSDIVPEWKDPNVYKTHLQKCRLETLANNAQLYCTIHIAQKKQADE